MKDVQEFHHWISSEEVSKIESIVSSWTTVPFVPTNGRFPNQLIANQHWHQWDDKDDLGQLLGDKIKSVIGPYRVVETDYVELFLPWDIHSEGFREADSVDLKKLCSIIIPFGDYPSRTIIFDQTGDGYNDFYLYKKKGVRAEHPINKDFWDANLSHCWDDDREFVSLKYVGQEWHRGDAMFFKRIHFHSSDNFHLRITYPKRFLQIITQAL